MGVALLLSVCMHAFPSRMLPDPCLTPNRRATPTSCVSRYCRSTWARSCLLMELVASNIQPKAAVGSDECVGGLQNILLRVTGCYPFSARNHELLKTWCSMCSSALRLRTFFFFSVVCSSLTRCVIAGILSIEAAPYTFRVCPCLHPACARQGAVALQCDWLAADRSAALVIIAACNKGMPTSHPENPQFVDV